MARWTEQYIIFPSTSKPVLCEKYPKKSREKAIRVEIPAARSEIKTNASRVVEGDYSVIASSKDKQPNSSTRRKRLISQPPTLHTSQSGTGANARSGGGTLPPSQARQNLVSEFWGKLVLDTPDQPSTGCSPLPRSRSQPKASCD